MTHISPQQTGDVGDITAGREPRDYVDYPYIEWYSDENGRVVLELDAEQVEVIGRPIPACESDPVSREEQARNMAGFLGELSRETGVPALMVSPLAKDPPGADEPSDQDAGPATPVDDRREHLGNPPSAARRRR